MCAHVQPGVDKRGTLEEHGRGVFSPHFSWRNVVETSLDVPAVEINAQHETALVLVPVRSGQKRPRFALLATDDIDAGHVPAIAFLSVQLRRLSNAIDGR